MPTLPSHIGRYEVKAELGRGGMATVYRAFDPLFKRVVAVKTLPHELLHDPSFRARFDREAQIIAALEHPAIVPVYDFGEDGGQPYIVMRYMAGGSLAEKLAAGSLPIVEVARIFSALAPALDHAHVNGIIHRDLKPGNILFDGNGNPYLADFGIARLIAASTALTGTAIVGTPAYMSPEQARGENDLDARSDLYALGVIMFQMLTGQLPYYADTPMGMAIRHITDPVPHARDRRPDLPRSVDGIVWRAMAKRREARYTTAARLASDLAAVGTPDKRSVPAGPSMAVLVNVLNRVNSGLRLPVTLPASANSPVLGTRRFPGVLYLGMLAVALGVAIWGAIGLWRGRSGSLIVSPTPSARVATDAVAETGTMPAMTVTSNSTTRPTQSPTSPSPTETPTRPTDTPRPSISVPLPTATLARTQRRPTSFPVISTTQPAATSSTSGQLVLVSPINLPCPTDFLSFGTFHWSYPLPLPSGWNFEVRVICPDCVASDQYEALRTNDQLSINGIGFGVYGPNTVPESWEVAVLDAQGHAVETARYTYFCPATATPNNGQ